MPIVHMANKPEEIPAGAVNVKDRSDDYRPALSEYWTEERRAAFYLATYETHHGLCISEHERNGYDDSDFYMILWNPEKQAPESYTFASTRGWSYPCYGSRADATPEVLAAYQAYQNKIAEEHRLQRLAEEAATPRKGKMLKVVKGRKVPKGTIGECIWVGDGRWGTRVGIKDAEGTAHWTAITNVEVVTGKEVI